MKTVAISTFNNSPQNYGALFQACALSRFIRKLGYRPLNVTVENRNHATVSSKTAMKIRIKKLATLPHKRKMRLRRKKLYAFAAETQTQVLYHNERELQENPPAADVYLSGSDQVWNPVNIHRDFFLTYAPGNAKRISYAASMGNENIPDSNREEFTRYIRTFNAISVREDTMKPVIGQFTDLPVHVHADPVFLMNREEWGELEKPYGGFSFDQYIFVYAVQWNSDWNRELAALKKRTGLPAVAVNMGNLHRTCADRILYDVSPNEFLSLLSGAEYVVTSSFHGTAMSIIYHKKFVTLTGSDKPTRILSLLRRFGLEAALTFRPEQLRLDDAAIDEIIERCQTEARDYLTEEIEG